MVQQKRCPLFLNQPQHLKKANNPEADPGSMKEPGLFYSILLFLDTTDTKSIQKKAPCSSWALW